MLGGGHKVKADIEKNFGGKCCPWLILTDSEKAIYLSKFCFIIICEERKHKVLILKSSEKFIIFLANIH